MRIAILLVASRKFHLLVDHDHAKSECPRKNCSFQSGDPGKAAALLKIPNVDPR